jgi:hypothetical protein
MFEKALKAVIYLKNCIVIFFQAIKYLGLDPDRISIQQKP